MRHRKTRISVYIVCNVFSYQYIDDTLPAESPYLYGLHPNAEIGFLTQTSEKLFRTVLEMQPRDGGVGEGGGTTRDEKVKKSRSLSLVSVPTWKNTVNLLLLVIYQRTKRLL